MKFGMEYVLARGNEIYEVSLSAKFEYHIGR